MITDLNAILNKKEKKPDRTILHCDLDGFYASVECLFEPKLKKVPMAVAGNPKNRHGIILAKNELAKKFNVKTAETIVEAKRKCPDLILVPPQHEEYAKYSRLVNNIYHEFTDLVEPYGIDESFLDVTGVYKIFGAGEEIANKLRSKIKKELGLTISAGVSFNKVFAKMGSDYNKPDGTTIINRENFKEIIYPMPARKFLYVGKKTSEKLGFLNIKTIGDIANSDKNFLERQLGKAGKVLWINANGLDTDPVKPILDGKEIKSVGNGKTFKRNLLGIDDIKVAVNALAEKVAFRLRKYQLKCTTLSVDIKDTNFKNISRQKTFEVPTYLAKEISDVALELIKNNWQMKKPIRALTITGANLVSEDHKKLQLSFFEENNNLDRNKYERLEIAIYDLKNRYGKDVLQAANLLENDLGLDNKK